MRAPAPTTRPLTFGTWIGGDRDGNPNVTPQVTRDVLHLQHEHGINDALDARSTSCAAALSTPSARRRHRGAARLAWTPTWTPARDRPRFKRLNAEEPYRLKATCIRRSWPTPASAWPRAPRTSPAATTSAPRELLADLELIQDLAARAPRRPDRRRPPGPHHPHRRRLRPAPGHHGRPRARRRPPPRARPALRPARRGVLALRRHAARLPAASCSPRSCARAGRCPDPGTRWTPPARRPSTSSTPSARPSSASAPRSSSRTSSR